MGLKLFGYSELSSDFGNWISANCSNCDENFNKIPDCFFGESEWKQEGTSEIITEFNNRQHSEHCGAPWQYHPDFWRCSPGSREKTTHWPPTYKIVADSQQDVQISSYTSDHIKSRLCLELEGFKDKDKYATENGLITYMNIIGKFMIQHFTFVTSPFTQTLLIIYTDGEYGEIEDVPQDTLEKDGEKNPPEESTRNLVHNKPIGYYIDEIFGNVKTQIRKVHWKYNISVWDHNWEGGTPSDTITF